MLLSIHIIYCLLYIFKKYLKILFIHYDYLEKGSLCIILIQNRTLHHSTVFQKRCKFKSYRGSTLSLKFAFISEVKHIPSGPKKCNFLEVEKRAEVQNEKGEGKTLDRSRGTFGEGSSIGWEAISD